MHTPDSGSDRQPHTPAHRPLHDEIHGHTCGEDGEPWPCPAERVQRELAEALSEFANQHGLGFSPWEHGRFAAALLSGPLAPLLADHAAVQRVEALAKEWENFGSRYTLTAGLGAEELHRALDVP